MLEANSSGSNSAVECQLPKLNVAGSIPVSRSKVFNDLHNPCSTLRSDYISCRLFYNRFTAGSLFSTGDPV